MAMTRYLPPDQVITLLGNHGLVPSVTFHDAASAELVAQALVDGGLPVVEVAFDTPGAATAICAMARRGDLLVGAGAVRTLWQADRAVAAGALFVTTPAFDDAVIERCLSHRIAILPGIVTAAEARAALEFGLAAAMTRPTADGELPRVARDEPGLRWLVSGTSGSLPHDQLRLPQVLAIGGDWLVPAVRESGSPGMLHPALP